MNPETIKIIETVLVSSIADLKAYVYIDYSITASLMFVLFLLPIILKRYRESIDEQSESGTTKVIVYMLYLLFFILLFPFAAYSMQVWLTPELVAIKSILTNR